MVQSIDVSPAASNQGKQFSLDETSSTTYETLKRDTRQETPGSLLYFKHTLSQYVKSHFIMMTTTSMSYPNTGQVDQ